MGERKKGTAFSAALTKVGAPRLRKSKVAICRFTKCSISINGPYIQGQNIAKYDQDQNARCRIKKFFVSLWGSATLFTVYNLKITRLSVVFLLSRIVGVFVCWTFVCSTASAAYSGDGEQMGEFRFSDFSLAPQLRLQEPGEGGFELRSSLIGFEWRKDETLRGVFVIGTNDINQSAMWFNTLTKPTLDLVEGYLEGKSNIGDMRVGLLNPHQGFEGAFPEWSWALPESRARRNGWMIKRDWGLQLRFASGSFLTAFTLHNGETTSNADGKFWYSGLWQWKNSSGLGMLVSASVGNTKQASTSTSTIANQGFVFDKTLDSKIRYGIFSLFREDEHSLVLLEFGRGDYVQSDIKNPYAWGRADLSWNFGGDLSMLLRFEQTQADLKNPNSIIQSSSVGFAMYSKNRLQSLTLLATGQREDPSVANDELLLLFKLNSKFLN